MIEIFLTNLIKNDSTIKIGNGKEIKISVSGHAGFGKKNEDIVCAGVSAIVQTAVIGISKVAGIRQKIKQKDGILESKIVVNKIKKAELDSFIIILKTMLAGLEEITKHYPEAIKIYYNN